MPELIHLPAPKDPTERRAFIVAILLRHYDLRLKQTDTGNETTARNVAVATARQKFPSMSHGTLHAWLADALAERRHEAIMI